MTSLLVTMTTTTSLVEIMFARTLLTRNPC